MSKSKFIKIVVSAATVLALCVFLTFNALAAPTVKVTYNYGGSVYNVEIEAGKSFAPMSPSVSEGDFFYGWMDESGNLFPLGKNATVDKDTVLYPVVGSLVSSEAELNAAIARGDSYVKLAKSFTVKSSVALGTNVLVIDTNDYTLYLDTAGDGFVGADSGLVFIGGGSVLHDCTSYEGGMVVNSLVSLSPLASFNNLVFSVGEGTTVETDVDFITIHTNTDKYKGAFKSSIYGTLTCKELVITNGISEGTLSVYANATVNADCEFFFEDMSQSTAARYISMYIYGGTFNLNKLNGVGRAADKYKCAITGGAFSENIASCFPAGNYSFTLNANTGYYSSVACVHSGPVVSGVPQSCTEAATLTYQCSYCDLTYTKDYPNGIGHTIVKTVEQPLITTEEITQVGINKMYCQKCGQAEYEYIYPSPQEVYVTVIVLDLKGKEKELRIHSKDLFTFNTSNPTVLNSFSTECIQAEPYNITQERIISVEIPLGTTEIYGSKPSDSEHGVGAFTKNQHLQEVVLPVGLKKIDGYAFRMMPKLKSIKGIENVTESIGAYAFSQTHTNVLIDQMEINASVIGEYAFENVRMNSLTIGKSVSNIQGGAFKLDASAEPVKEVFIEGYTSSTTVGLTVPYVLSNIVRKTYNSSNQQFGTRGIVYTDHQYNITVYKADCYKSGYSHYECMNCSYEKIDDEVARLSHEFQNIHVVPTCLTQGYTVDKCLNCGEEKAETKIVSEKRDPNAHDFTYSTGNAFVNISNGALLQEGNICENYYCVVGKCKCGALDYESLKGAHIIEPATGGKHDYDTSNMTVIKEPNCGEYGQARATCKVCASQTVLNLPKSGENHKWDAGVITKEPTCTEKGVRKFTCTVCNDKSGVKEVSIAKDTKNHSWDEGVVEREPTDMVSGVKRISCVRCDYSFTEGINKTTTEESFPVWAIILIAVGGVLLVAGVVLTLYFTFFKKKRASDSFKYKFNTLGI